MEDARGPPRDKHFRIHQGTDFSTRVSRPPRQQCEWTCPMSLADAREMFILIQVVVTWVDVYVKSAL